MTDKLFKKLWEDALAQPNRELYIAEYGCPDWFDEISPDISVVISTLSRIHDVAHMSIRDMISKTGLTQSAFALRLCMPIRTVEDWVSGKRNCLDYIRLAYAKCLGLFTLCLEEKEDE